ncbi:DUF805 domain-containing protein [Halosquirtibacter laminarini]|uniref:DUF805 domain-containing protein n=1 Tax=Halosquirtibacter laminarini TaxID=3374600 RepID=A0AC61NI58_9BACT|nr:DUF805 domain-containing protein [Prolixibacteraceae bacterium]
MKEFIYCFKNYAQFNGRAGRREYWMFILFNMIVSFLISFINPILGYIYSVAVIIPGLAVSVRRLHDLGKSGWFYLLCLIPIVGWIILIVWFATKGEEGENQYGESAPIIE